MSKISKLDEDNIIDIDYEELEELSITENEV